MPVPDDETPPVPAALPGIPIMLADEARPLDDGDRIPREVRADDDG